MTLPYRRRRVDSLWCRRLLLAPLLVLALPGYLLLGGMYGVCGAWWWELKQLWRRP